MRGGEDKCKRLENLSAKRFRFVHALRFALFVSIRTSLLPAPHRSAYDEICVFVLFTFHAI